MQETVDIAIHRGNGSSVHASLIVYEDEGARAIPLPPDADFVFGRLPEAEVGTEDPSLSRKHARFFVENGEPWVEDLGSRNGTLVNGESVGRSKLQTGDEITMGAVTASLHIHNSGQRWVRGQEEEPGTEVIASPAMVALYNTIDRIARANIPVLIVGETGAGKEVVSRAIHHKSDRNERPDGLRQLRCDSQPVGRKYALRT